MDIIKRIDAIIAERQNLRAEYLSEKIGELKENLLSNLLGPEVEFAHNIPIVDLDEHCADFYNLCVVAYMEIKKELGENVNLPFAYSFSEIPVNCRQEIKELSEKLEADEWEFDEILYNVYLLQTYWTNRYRKEAYEHIYEVMKFAFLNYYQLPNLKKFQNIETVVRHWKTHLLNYVRNNRED